AGGGARRIRSGHGGARGAHRPARRQRSPARPDWRRGLGRRGPGAHAGRAVARARRRQDPRRGPSARAPPRRRPTRYDGVMYRPPSEADAYILQATIGCSWNHCTYCDMYRDKRFRVRPLEECLEDLDAAPEWAEKLFVADGDALVMPSAQWLPILERARA